MLIEVYWPTEKQAIVNLKIGKILLMTSFFLQAAAAVKVPKLKINLGERVDSHNTSHSRGHSSSHHHHHKSSSSSSSSKKHKKHKRKRIESDSDDDIVSVHSDEDY